MVTSYAYDLMSNLTGVTDALNRTNKLQLRRFQPAEEDYTSGSDCWRRRLEENFTYDLAGKSVGKEKDQANRIISFCYDSVNRLTSSTDGALKVTSLRIQRSFAVDGCG